MANGWIAAGSAALMLWGGSSVNVGAQTVAVLLDRLQVRLWYQETGRLSEDIAPPKSISLWNTIIGEGAAEEIADDALFTVRVRTLGEQNVSLPLVLTATTDVGKILAQRTFSHILTSEAGAAVLPLWVVDVGCAGTIVFAARIGAERGSFSINFPCGE